MANHRRILSPRINGPIRRSLFGSVDHEQLQVEYQAALRKDLEDAAQRWNFDFVSDMPLEGGDFQWECIPGTNVPLLYRSYNLGLGPVEAQRVGATVPEKNDLPHTPEKCTVTLQSLDTTLERVESTMGKRKQTSITDFFQSKRRVVGMPRKSGQ